jgi:hypothetical protein
MIFSCFFCSLIFLPFFLLSYLVFSQFLSFSFIFLFPFSYYPFSPPISHLLLLHFSFLFSIPLFSLASSPISLLFSPLGTNAFPSAAESYYYNKKDYLNKYLDYSQLSEKDKNSMHSLVDHHKSHGMF